MTKLTADVVLDAPLDKIINEADQLVLCEAAPTTYAEATSDKGAGGVALGEVAIGAANWTKSDGDVSGRKATLESLNWTVDVSGTNNHWAIIDDGAGVLLHVGEASGEAVTAGNNRTTDAVDIELGDPT